MRGIAVFPVALVLAGCVASSASPLPPASASPTTTDAVASPRSAASTPSPSALARYPDGIPSSFDGQPVLRGAAVLAKARSMTTAEPFLVGAWLDVYSGGSRSCPIETRSLPPDSWFHACPEEPLVYASDDAGAEPGALLSVLWGPKPAITFRFATGLQSGPAILRVHVHDPRASQCGPDEPTCDAMMVAERAVWFGDAATHPHPISVDATLAAIERAAPGTGLRHVGDSETGSWALLRDGARLVPPYHSLDPSSADALVLAASVLPSVDAVLRALPGVTSGPAGALLKAAEAGEWGYSDKAHKWWFMNRWLVVENVAVLVSTLPTPSTADRALLARLADALERATASPAPSAAT